MEQDSKKKFTSDTLKEERRLDLRETLEFFDMCADCRGSGTYIGLSYLETCKTCEGAGFVEKGYGFDYDKVCDLGLHN